jgi:misacylated tRNA(Ala) deacylase
LRADRDWAKQHGMTEFLFRDDSYLRETPATVRAVTPEGGIVLDRTVFYAASGGQPGDTGALVRADGSEIVVATAIHPDGDKTAIVHVPAEGQPVPAPGEAVTAVIAWDRRYALMRMHTALHLLSVVLPFPVTGGSVGAEKGRLDFDMPEVPADLPALEAELNGLAGGSHDVTAEWITDAEMAAQMDLIKTMKVRPPMGQGRVRLIRIGSVDLQPCGGTHVRNTSEIGALRLGKIEKKGAINRRVSVLFV